jgi:2-(1,2-epoxy-1,2-dihydrophenyl)acetyl-CoA isomerase
MSLPAVSVSVGDDHVAWVEVCRPPNNFFSMDTIGGIADALEHLDGDDQCRSVVLCAQGKHFSAGADFAGDRSYTTEQLYATAVRIFRSAKPVVAAIQGAAIGGGLGLALAADFRITAPEGRFSANFARLGFHQGFGLSVTLPRLVGEQAAAELLLTGRRIDGAGAVAIGLADRLVELDGLRPAAHALALEIARSAPLAVRSIRATLRGDLADRVAVATEHEAAEQARLQATTDFAEGARAMAERRLPDFGGH